MEVSRQPHFLAAVPPVRQPGSHLCPSIYELEKESKVQWADLQVADVRAEFGGNIRRSKMWEDNINVSKVRWMQLVMTSAWLLTLLWLCMLRDIRWNAPSKYRTKDVYFVRVGKCRWRRAITILFYCRHFRCLASLMVRDFITKTTVTEEHKVLTFCLWCSWVLLLLSREVRY
jgi:hypothetical protein